MISQHSSALNKNMNTALFSVLLKLYFHKFVEMLFASQTCQVN